LPAEAFPERVLGRESDKLAYQLVVQPHRHLGFESLLEYSEPLLLELVCLSLQKGCGAYVAESRSTPDRQRASVQVGGTGIILAVQGFARASDMLVDEIEVTLSVPKAKAIPGRLGRYARLAVPRLEPGEPTS